MKLKFLSDAFYNGICVFSKGDVVNIDDESYAMRWVRRGIAVELVEEIKNKSKKEEKENVEALKVENQEISATMKESEISKEISNFWDTKNKVKSRK